MKKSSGHRQIWTGLESFFIEVCLRQKEPRLIRGSFALLEVMRLLTHRLP